ncbi:hypothetical protein REPUB_Repub05bG0105400 [Reevesia pubescens]
MMRTFKVVWMLVKELGITVLDDNLFFFKFRFVTDKERVGDGLAWSFDKHLLVLKDFDGDPRLKDCVCVGNFKSLKKNHNPTLQIKEAKGFFIKGCVTSH